MLKLLLIRHGESTSNRDRRMSGQDDVPLTPHGHRQCQHLATWLYQQRWQPSHIYTSPLRRTVESVTELLSPWQWQPPSNWAPAFEAATISRTAIAPPPTSLINQGPYPPPQLMTAAHLQEFQAGILTGLTWSEAQQRYPDLCQKLETSRDWVPIPEAETPHYGRQRAEAFVDQLLQNHQNGDAVWVMSHQWLLEHLLAALLGGDRTWQIPMPNTAIFEIWLDRDRWTQPGMSQFISDLWQIKHFNATPHLTAIVARETAISREPP